MRRGAWWYGDKKKGTSMKKMKNRLTAIAAVAFASVLACGVLAGCSSDKGEQKAGQLEQTAAATLEGQKPQHLLRRWRDQAVPGDRGRLQG